MSATTEQSWATQPGNCCTRRWHGSPRGRRRMSARHSTATCTCLRAFTPAASARHTFSSCCASTRRKPARATPQASGAASCTTSSTTVCASPSLTAGPSPRCINAAVPMPMPLLRVPELLVWRRRKGLVGVGVGTGWPAPHRPRRRRRRRKRRRRR